MTQREAWEEVKFQIFTDESGVLRSGFYPTGAGIVQGNVAVDHAWGNMPIQPDDDRTDTLVTIPQVEDAGWSQPVKFGSDILNVGSYEVVTGTPGISATVPTDNGIVQTGYSNYPAFIENYAGDGDTGLEAVVPNVVGKPFSEAISALNAVGLDGSRFELIPGVEYAVASGATVVLTLDQDYKFKKGDSVWVDQFTCDTISYGVGSQTLTAVSGNTITFPNTAEWAFDAVATGAVWATDAQAVRVRAQDANPGDIVDAGTLVRLDVIYVD